jgi:oligosaccharide repeat unit polymerase
MRVIWPLSVVLIASIFVALLIPRLDANGWSLLEGLSLLGVVILALIPTIHSWANKTFDLFEPVHMVALATIISFALAPALLIGRDQIIIGGGSFRDKLLEAIVLAGLTLIGFYLGYYFVRQHSRNARKFGNSEHLVNSPGQYQIHRRATAGLLISFGVYLIWLELTNLPLSALNSLSESGYYGLAFSLAKTNYVFLFQIRTTWIALLLLAYPARSQKRKHKLVIGLLWLVVALIFAMSGSRGILFELLIATAAYTYLLKRKRPKKSNSVHS